MDTNDLKIEKGTKQDIDELEQLYYEITDYLDSHINYPGWKKGIYPDRSTAEEGIEENNLFVARSEGRIVGTVILSHEPPEVFLKVNWNADLDYRDVLMIYTLAVHPQYLRSGIGKQMLDFIIEYSKQNHIKAIRLDVFEKNIPAVKLYQSFGFQYIDSVDPGYEGFGSDQFKLYQKLL